MWGRGGGEGGRASDVGQQLVLPFHPAAVSLHAYLPGAVAHATLKNCNGFRVGVASKKGGEGGRGGETDLHCSALDTGAAVPDAVGALNDTCDVVGTGASSRKVGAGGECTVGSLDRAGGGLEIHGAAAAAAAAE